MISMASARQAAAKAMGVMLSLAAVKKCMEQAFMNDTHL